MTLKEWIGFFSTIFGGLAAMIAIVYFFTQNLKTDIKEIRGDIKEIRTDIRTLSDDIKADRRAMTDRIDFLYQTKADKKSKK